jgi:DDE superfamily endonuclease
VLCGGDIDEIKQTTTTTLTWLEEWYVFFEVIYGKSICRWVDGEYKYKINHQTIRYIYDKKLKHVLRVRKAWPRYVSMNEDNTYRKDKKWDDYKGKRVIMFDNTNINMYQPSDAAAQRATYSLYYSGNVGKGACFIQPCGWMGCHDIWTGGVSDTHYMQHSGVFESLNDCIKNSSGEDDNTRLVPYTIILDKGYRVTMDALNNGGHYVLQPIFAEVDKRFTTLDITISSTVSSDRSGNERAVRYSKISDYISKGLHSSECSRRLCKTWLCWGFQVNFMYKPVH